MLLLTVAIFDFLTQALAQTITAPAAAATTLAAAATTLTAAATTAAATPLDPGDCSNADFLNCWPQSSTICLANSITDIQMGIACACDHAQTVISCYARYCPGPYSESYLSSFSAASIDGCNGLSTISFPFSEPTGAVMTTLSSETTGTGTGAGVAATASGTAASATSKAGAERGAGHAVPVLGGLLGAFIGAVGIIFVRKCALS